MILSRSLLVIVWTAVLISPLPAQEMPYATGTWDWERLGNHRAVVRVDRTADAVGVEIPWRRRDRNPNKLIIVTGPQGDRIENVQILEITNAMGRLLFQPSAGPGDYFIYFMPFEISGRKNYPTVTYLPVQRPPKGEWAIRIGLTGESLERKWATLPRARTTEFQSIDELNSFYPMEVIATDDEVQTLLEQNRDRPFLLFPEDRELPIRMFDRLPQRWILSGPGRTYEAVVSDGEFYVLQIGVYAIENVTGLEVAFSDLAAPNGQVISKDRLRCFNLGGVDSKGERFEKKLSLGAGEVQPLWIGIDLPPHLPAGPLSGEIRVRGRDTLPRSISLKLETTGPVIAARGDDTPARHSRLRWLDSRIALNDTPTDAFPAPGVSGRTIDVLGRRVKLGDNGLPISIKSFFTYAMTGLEETAREILASPILVEVTDTAGKRLSWGGSKQWSIGGAEGRPSWEVLLRSGALEQRIQGSLDFDGTLDYEIELNARQEMRVSDISLELPVAADVARYMMGMSFKGGKRPASFAWKWKVENNQDSIWVGDVNAGLQLSLSDEKYVRPLNTNFYLSKPLVMPVSWNNGGAGGCRMTEEENQFNVTCYSGERTLRAGESLFYNFRLAITPFKPIDTRRQWATRFYHRFTPLEEIAATGANTVNVHHANEVNPYINYPFLSVDRMKAFVDEGHQRGMKVKIYYTVRELTNRAHEIFALRSLGDEIFSEGPGGGFPWLQEHLQDDYIAGWLVPDLQDAAIINSGVSRWHNYYLEGLDWVMRNIGIDGLYIDDVAFDRTTMKRVRKIMDRRNPGSLIDLHSANQYNERDGFASSANLYMEHFPYIDRLWFGEYFDYDSAPDYWLIELSGIPFGLMGEMLQDGGNPWRGMLYGMTSRLPWAGDPRPLWKFWDTYRIEDSRMIGYWVPDRPVQTSSEQVVATSFVGKDRALVAIASWSEQDEAVQLKIDWDALGLEAGTATIRAPAVPDFQEEGRWELGTAIRVPKGRGLLLVIQ